MALKAFIYHILAITFLVFPIVSFANFSFPAIFNFGDSNSDTGGLAAGIAFPVGPPHGQTYFLKPSGRFSDGQLIIDFPMNALDLPFLNPYLDSVGAPNFQNGCNLATGGSTRLPANAASTSPFSFGIQVAQFVKFKTRVLELLAKGISTMIPKKMIATTNKFNDIFRELECKFLGFVTEKKLQDYLPSEESFNQALYMFDVGQNDLDGAFYSKSEDQVLALIPIILTEFETGIKVVSSIFA